METHFADGNRVVRLSKDRDAKNKGVYASLTGIGTCKVVPKPEITKEEVNATLASLGIEEEVLPSEAKTEKMEEEEQPAIREAQERPIPQRAFTVKDMLDMEWGLLSEKEVRYYSGIACTLLSTLDKANQELVNHVNTFSKSWSLREKRMERLERTVFNQSVAVSDALSFIFSVHDKQ